MADSTRQTTHFVLIHGSASGAWAWYKVKTILEAAGHSVTALDMSASGVNTKTLEEVVTFDQYNEPLIEFMANLAENEKVVLVAHSLGGLNVAFAMEKFPEKISLAVFVTAFLPDTEHQPSYMLEKFIENSPAVADGWQSVVSSTTGYEAFMKSTAFSLASPEDLSLQTLLKRSGSLFLESLAKANKFTKEKFGSVVRDYVVCTQDLLVVPSLQRFMIEHNEVKEVMEIPADHMAIVSRPKELCQCLLEFARKHA
ncbi:PREDICTED: salicylic acid-binding protein 2-like isoform X1 [Populus euphratica]|uniref:(S)-hydroxynitrile lyase n=1 Tax=Populus euphratica TaxID=75702 RepID=A0AAJ6V100_POPEU|nr:PREDICTED: salicylic acid-binding protein 2-like isoform X1 [Populus euphratica]